MKKYNVMCAKPYMKDGEQKTRWVKIGSVVQMPDGKMFGDLDALPTGTWFDGSIQLFEQDQQNNAPQQNQGVYNQQQQGGGYQPQQNYNQQGQY